MAPPDKPRGRPGGAAPHKISDTATSPVASLTPAPDYGAAIFPQHADRLEKSAISPEVARERGYVSVDTRTRLDSAGFAKWQRRVPGLLIPVHDTSGAVATWQYRPDSPRTTKAEKVVKYETPGGSRLVLDVPPRVRAQLGDPDVPLWITEGVRKADAAASAGLACIGLSGVDGWRGTNGQGGKVALSSWNDIALNGRRIYLAFDSDAASNPKVAGALERLGSYLLGKQADVRFCYLPSGEDGAKVGLDDYLAAGGSIEALIEGSTPKLVVPVQPELPAANDSLSHPLAVASHLHTPPSWASDQDILARLVCDMGVWCGFTGEHRNARLTYLAITTRILDDPVSLALKGLSSSGKSYTVGTVLKFVPDEAVIAMTAMSERALIYMEDDFSHRTLVLYEAVALREEREKTESNLTAYIVRSLLSEGEIRYPVTVKGPDGKMVTKTIVKKGPTNFIVTTTAASLHGENETRMISLPTDDSAGQTSAIMASIAAGKRDEADFGEWHAYARWIAAGNKSVVIPYAPWLAASIPPVAVRLRRDFRALLRLIQAHAIMHQLNRETDAAGRIVATEADYLAVRALVADLISDAVGKAVPPATRETVEAIAKLDAGEGVKVHDLELHFGLERSTVQYRVTSAREKGYLVNVEEKRNRAARYRPGNPLPHDVVILPERIEGVNSHPDPAHHTPDDAAPQASGGADAGCEGVNQPQRGQCAECGNPLDQALIDAGYTDHGEAGQ
jgi:Domain of unknown function (DUF3854)